MTNRPAGGDRSKRWAKSDMDFYREPSWADDMILDTLDFGPSDNLDLIWDPTCGKGATLDAAKKRGHMTIGSDVVDRKPAHKFFRGNILQITSIPKPPVGKSMSIICNPPYSYLPDIAEKVMRRTMDMPIRRAAFIVPVAFLNGQARQPFFMKEFNPSHVLIYSRRPTMPPGDMIDEMSSAYEGGMQDYCVVVFSFPHRWKTQLIWMAP